MHFDTIFFIYFLAESSVLLCFLKEFLSFVVLLKPHYIQYYVPLQIDARILRAVAIEHPKDADEAAAVVLSEIIPSFSSNLFHNFTQSSYKSSGSISEREGTTL